MCGQERELPKCWLDEEPDEQLEPELGFFPYLHFC